MSAVSADCVVVGAGVVGLAIARALAEAGRDVIILEREHVIGSGISSRNSEVIHGGLYYPKGSLKARLCIAGRDLLYAYCTDHGVLYKRLGKIVVACVEADTPLLDAVWYCAEANGVDDLVALTGTEARSLEPNLRCLKAFLSPSTGIVDSHGLMLAYQGDAEAKGAAIAFGAPVQGGRVEEHGFTLEIGGGDAMTLCCKTLINSAGLGAPTLARQIKGIPPETIPRDYYCRGVYFTLSGRAPFSRLVYPVPGRAGLGVHLTLDLAGQARFGPDTEWIDRLDYTVDPRRSDSFYAAVRQYWPGLRDGALQPGYAGIRPKISGPHEPAADFMIQGEAEHRIPGLVNLYGIESPGLTASLAIAEQVKAMLGAG